MEGRHVFSGKNEKGRDVNADNRRQEQSPTDAVEHDGVVGPKQQGQIKDLREQACQPRGNRADARRGEGTGERRMDILSPGIFR